MDERMSGVSLEGWRLRRRPTRAPNRAPRVVVVGESQDTLECVRRLAAMGTAEVILSAETPAAVRAAQVALSGAARVAPLLERAAPSDAVIVFGDDAARVRDVALWAARTCPLTALVIASDRGLALSREAARGSGLAPWLILSPGGMPCSHVEALRLSRRFDVSPSQVSVPVIGGDCGDGASRTLPLRRYASVAGVPARAISESDWQVWAEEPASGIPVGALVGSVVALTCAVLEDRREVLSCGAWVEGAFGIPGGFVSLPVRVGSRGAEEPLALKLTLEERALLQRTASDAR